MNIHVHFDMQKISTNARLHLYLTNSPTPLSLSLTASWNYHAKFYRVNMICACLFSNGDESWRQEQVLWCFDQLDAVRRGYVSLSVLELPVYWSQCGGIASLLNHQFVVDARTVLLYLYLVWLWNVKHSNKMWCFQSAVLFSIDFLNKQSINYMYGF